MSKKEFDRLDVLLGVRSGRLRVADAFYVQDMSFSFNHALLAQSQRRPSAAMQGIADVH
jgi:hypothetical protein